MSVLTAIEHHLILERALRVDMRFLSSSCHLLIAFNLLSISDAILRRKDFLEATGELVERQASDGAGSVSSGSTGAVDPGPVQTQNLTSTVGSTQGIGNGTTTTSPGYIVLPGNVEEEQVICTNITTGRANRCWDELGLTQWVQNWAADNLPKCYEYEGFSSCFLRLNGFPSLDCSQISPGACDAPQSSLTINLLTNPEIYYIVYNIYGMLASRFP